MYDARRGPWRTVLVGLACAAAACSTTTAPSGGVVFDGAGTLDVATADDVGGRSEDAGLADDGGGHDSSTADADPSDAAGAGDAGGQDVAADPCGELAASYDVAAAGAFACEDDWFCSLAIPDKLECPCQAMANPTLASTGEALSLLQSWNEKQCGSGFCADLACPDFTNKLGSCKGGACEAVDASCNSVSAAWVKLAQHLRTCTADADCSAKMPLTPGCPGCTIPVNANAEQPEPYQQYIAQLTLVFNDYLACDAGGCGCDTSEKVPKCVSGICQAVAR